MATRDSAGVAIVENVAPVWTEQTRWRIADQPTLAIGGGITGDPAREFGYIGNAHRLSDRTIAVLDIWAPSLTFFDSTGMVLGVTAKTGSGPGELPRRGTRASFTCADTVFVHADRRFLGYSPPGVYVRTITTQQPTRSYGCAHDRFVGWLRYSAWRTEPGIGTDTLQLGWFATSGAVLSVIDTFPSDDRLWSRNPEGVGYMQLPCGRKLAVAVHDSLLATAYGTMFEIQLRDTAGATSRIIRVAGLERTVGAAELDRFRDFVSDWGGNDDERRRMAAAIEAAEGRPMPAVGELRFDRPGLLWARLYDHLDAVAFFDFSSFIPSRKRPVIDTARRWLVLHPDGRFLGVVALPPSFTVYEIGDDWILGVWRDELDIQSVRVYPLIKPAA